MIIIGEYIGVDTFRIRFNGITHLRFRIDQYKGFQSWIRQNALKNYQIEIYFYGSDAILVEYARENDWKEVIEELEKIK